MVNGRYCEAADQKQQAERAADDTNGQGAPAAEADTNERGQQGAGHAGNCDRVSPLATCCSVSPPAVPIRKRYAQATPWAMK